VHQVPVRNLARLNRLLAQVIIVDHRANLKQLGMLHWEDILDGDCCDTCDGVSVLVEFLTADFESLAPFKCLFNLPDCLVRALLRLLGA
jgi:hypothetical protein